jgi:GNAT superfamily N-acetyltransferase
LGLSAPGGPLDVASASNSAGFAFQLDAFTRLQPPDWASWKGKTLRLEGAAATLKSVLAVMTLDHRESETARAIVALQKPAYAVEAALIGYDKMPGLLELPADVAALDLTLLGAFEGGILVGVLGYQRIEDLVDVDRVAVSTAHFRKGIGRRLLEALHERESTALRFEVSTGAANPAAIALYIGVGYRPVRTETLAGIDIVHLARH